VLSAGVKNFLLRKRLERRGLINPCETRLKNRSGLLLLPAHPCIDNEDEGLKYIVIAPLLQY